MTLSSSVSTTHPIKSATHQTYINKQALALAPTSSITTLIEPHKPLIIISLTL